MPVSSSTVFEIGSISKQITAAAVMMLVEERKVSLNDPLSKYIAESPESWRGVTVRHLLTHTSGLKNYNGLAGFELRERLKRAEFVKRIGAYPPSFAPGETHSYGNVNYSLLGYVIEQVSELLAVRFRAHSQAARKGRDARPRPALHQEPRARIRVGGQPARRSRLRSDGRFLLRCNRLHRARPREVGSGVQRVYS